MLHLMGVDDKQNLVRKIGVQMNPADLDQMVIATSAHGGCWGDVARFHVL